MDHRTGKDDAAVSPMEAQNEGPANRPKPEAAKVPETTTGHGARGSEPEEKPVPKGGDPDSRDDG